MQVLGIAALLLSAVAARPDSQRLWQSERNLPSRGPKIEDFRAAGFMTDGPGVLNLGLGRRFGRPRGPPRGRLPDRRIPGALDFSPTFKIDNVAFQNTTGVTLKEGENVFLMPRLGGRGHHHHKGGNHGPPMTGQYVKLLYNATEPNKVSIEYGILKPTILGKLVGEGSDPEGDYFQL